jgi:hypothetical protein
MGLLYGRAGRLTAENGGFRPGQWTGIGDFPFVWAQLAPYTGYAPWAGRGDVSTVRLAQADDLPHVGLDL